MHATVALVTLCAFARAIAEESFVPTAPPVSDNATNSTVGAPDSVASETLVHPTPWQQTTSATSKGPASGDVEILRSIELDLVFDDEHNGSTANSKTASIEDDVNQFPREHAGRRGFKPSPPISFRPEDVLLATSSESRHIPCKEIRTRSISEEDDPDDDFDFHSRLLLGKILLRGRDSQEASSTKQSRVLDGESIRVSKNDYPVESISKRPNFAARRLAARSKVRNLSNETRSATSARSPASSVARGESTRATLQESAELPAAPDATEAPERNEGIEAAANNLEFGAKTGEREPVRYRVTTHAPQTARLPSERPHVVLATTPAPATPSASRDPAHEVVSGTERDETSEPYSSVSIQRGNVDQIPYVPTKDVQLVPVRVHKQPTQVIFIQPYTPEYKQSHLPYSDTSPTPVFDNHQWVPVYVQEAYVPLLVGPRQQHLQHPHSETLRTTHQHTAPISFTENHHSLGEDFSGITFQYPPEAWSWSSHQHSTPSTPSATSPIAERKFQ